MPLNPTPRLPSFSPSESLMWGFIKKKLVSVPCKGRNISKKKAVLLSLPPAMKPGLITPFHLAPYTAGLAVKETKRMHITKDRTRVMIDFLHLLIFILTPSLILSFFIFSNPNKQLKSPLI